MRRTSRSSDAGPPDAGAYAVLYAALVVVLLAFSAIVVDLGAVRQDRRLDRSAADAAALGGAAFLNSGSGSGSSPLAACTAAWSYLAATLNISASTYPNRCAPFTGLALAPCPPAAVPYTPVAISGDRSVVIEWPVPKSDPFLTPDLAPGSVSQPFASVSDGSNAGCDRIGVAILQNQKFGLASAFGVTGTSTQVHSVARSVAKPGNAQELAALNVLNTTTCQALSTGGQGDIIVNSASDGSRGVIAVESDASGCSNNNKFAIDLSSNGNNLVCAAGPNLIGDPAAPSTTCTGRIEQHALDGSSCQYAYPGASSGCAGAPNVPLYPTPTAEGGLFGWDPVSSVYGCSALAPVAGVPAEQPCSSYPPYMGSLFTQYNVDGTRTTITPYTGVGSTGTAPGWGYGAFKVLPGDPSVPLFTSCSPSNVYIPPGNWYVNCDDKNKSTAGFQPSGTVVFGGGHVIFSGSVSVASNPSCLAVNVVETQLTLACPTVLNVTSNQALVLPPPSSSNPNALVFIRGAIGLTTGANGIQLYLPQTTVVQANGGLLNIGGGGNATSRLFWSAPGARSGGAKPLAAACTAGSTPNQACLDSHFEKIAYWNETATSSINSIGGQGSLGLIGVFFTPRSPMIFAGQAGFAAQAAQFWADTLGLGGQGNLVMSPDTGVSITRPAYSTALIR